MSEKFQNKYRIKSARLQSWDYGQNAAYFVTICTKDRCSYFGSIQNEEMQFSEIGRIAFDYWQEIPEHFPFVELGDFTIMPNHVHGIIIINKPDNSRTGVTINTDTVETQNFASLHFTFQSEPKNKFGPQSQNLASIVRGYKSVVKKYATMHHIEFTWQARFHDHIIRDEQSYQRISDYIQNNPFSWKEDRFYI